MLELESAVIGAFLDELDEIREAEEFEHLMLVGDAEPKFDLERFADGADIFEARPLRASFYREPSAIEELRGRLALERLRRRHPEVWERVERAGALDG
jgi:hypothetical protein